MTRGAGLHGLSPVSPGEVAQSLGGSFTDEDIPGLFHQLHTTRTLNESTAAMDVTGPGELDESQLELAAVREFARVTGRPPNKLETDGAQVPGCVACARLAWACRDHQRRKGTPIPLPKVLPPPRPRRPGEAPYDIMRSVAGAGEADDWPAGR